MGGYASTWHGLRKIYLREGVAGGLYKGLTLTMLKGPLQSAVSRCNRRNRRDRWNRCNGKEQNGTDVTERNRRNRKEQMEQKEQKGTDVTERNRFNPR